MKLKAYKTFYIFLLLTLVACRPEELKYPPITEDFCAQLPEAVPVKLSDYLAPYDALLASKTGVHSLEEGDVSMITRAWLTEAAEHTIDIQYFIFSTDNVGLIAADFLLGAADRGVKIRIIVDDIMVEAEEDDLLAMDAHPTLEVKIYNPNANIGKNLPSKLLSLATDFQGFNQRMHNKTFIVDQQVVITGGRNIADEYFDYDHEYNFRDRDVLLVGKKVQDVQQSFDLFWESDLSVPVGQLAHVTDEELNLDVKYAYLHQYACNPENFWPEVREKVKQIPAEFQKAQASGSLVWTDSVQFISDLPGKNDGSQGLAGGGVATDSLVSLIRRAKSSILIQSPYLITTEVSQQLFKTAVDRGVTVKILTNSLSSTDNLEAFSGYQRDREKLLDMGVKIYEFKPDAAIRFEVMTGALQKKMDFTPVFGLHAKSMVIDDNIAVIGTFNLDPRSANLNTECIVVVYDHKVAGDLRHAMEVDIRPENAWETTLDFNPDAEAGQAKQFKVWLRGVMPKSIL
ncbi:MAG: phospholipase D family protein [Imperialibacter sp.]|uniref:phospholipase D-like domain-containing protein n=1 Tax=Imperialibacter sp. TaxID=2038411 RepID=UPI0032EF4D31